MKRIITLLLLCWPTLHAMEFPAKVAVTMYVCKRSYIPFEEDENYDSRLQILPLAACTMVKAKYDTVAKWTFAAHYDAQKCGYIGDDPQSVQYNHLSPAIFDFMINIHAIEHDSVCVSWDLKPSTAEDFSGMDNSRITFSPDTTPLDTLWPYKLPWFSDYYLKIKATK